MLLMGNSVCLEEAITLAMQADAPYEHVLYHSSLQLLELFHERCFFFVLDAELVFQYVILVLCIAIGY